MIPAILHLPGSHGALEHEVLKNGRAIELLTGRRQESDVSVTITECVHGRVFSVWRDGVHLAVDWARMGSEQEFLRKILPALPTDDVELAFVLPDPAKYGKKGLAPLLIDLVVNGVRRPRGETKVAADLMGIPLEPSAYEGPVGLSVIDAFAMAAGMDPFTRFEPTREVMYFLHRGRKLLGTARFVVQTEKKRNQYEKWRPQSGLPDFFESARRYDQAIRPLAGAVSSPDRDHSGGAGGRVISKPTAVAASRRNALLLPFFR